MNVDDFRRHEVNRRQFLGSSARNAAGMAAAGMVGLAGVVAKASPNEQMSVGVIGVRGQGLELAHLLAAFSDVDVAALCDIDESLRHPSIQRVEKIQEHAPRWENDFRRLLDDRTIDAVVIATPDHWHAPMTILACQAGKDVYVESPVSHTADEGPRMVEIARRNQRVVQSGLQQRSGKHFQSAVEFVRSGKLGNVTFAKAWTVHRRKSIGFRKDSAAPPQIDYDLWLGPAVARPFNANRCHYNWRWFWDYGSGELGHWGVHMLDVARWGLGVELPTRIAAAGGKQHMNDDQETPDTLTVNYTYPSKTIVWEHRLWSTHGIEGRSTGTAFYGEHGTLVVDRGGWKVYDVKDSITAESTDHTRRHLRNFIDSVRKRTLPTADLEIGHTSSMLCHLGNIAYRLGREIAYDPESQTFADAGALALSGGEYRKPWDALIA